MAKKSENELSKMFELLGDLVKTAPAAIREMRAGKDGDEEGTELEPGQPAELWIGISKTANAEAEAGFRYEVVFCLEHPPTDNDVSNARADAVYRYVPE